MIFPTTPAQTVGPYFAIGLPWEAGPFAAAPEADGAITLAGTVRDGHGDLVPDHLIETWQADPDGHFADLHDQGGPSTFAGFRGWARSGHEVGDGSFSIVTVKPGRVPTPDGRLQAPHLAVALFARGLARHLVSRVYFADEEEANAQDPVLAALPAERRATLLAEPVSGGYVWDVRIQGEGETVFFDV